MFHCFFYHNGMHSERILPSHPRFKLGASNQPKQTMKTVTTGSAPKSRRTLAEEVARVLIGTAAVLVVPFLAMQFSREVKGPWAIFLSWRCCSLPQGCCTSQC